MFQGSLNTHTKSSSVFQVGPKAIVVFQGVVFRTTGQGQDEVKLEGWANIAITYKNGITTTIITCYCPPRGIPPGIIYSQHLLYISGNNNIPENIVCLRQLFGHDLKESTNKNGRGPSA